jgi:SAM-dependent methyltransferase
MTPTAAYDEIADWYEREFLARTAPGTDPLGVARAVQDLLGPGHGICLEIGCGTGVHAAQVSELGWTPVGIDLSGAMLRHARGRLPVAMADAARLPVADGSLPAVIAVMVHTDMPGYPAVRREAAYSRTSACIRASAAGSPTEATPAPWSSAPAIWTGTGPRPRGRTRASGTR